jgi:hypothetical protein
MAPPRALRVLAGEPVDRPAVRVARVLGARQLVQAAVLTTYQGPRWRRAGAAVDAAHAASMLALARLSRRPAHRRLAAHNARSAAALAAAEWTVSLALGRTGNRGDSHRDAANLGRVNSVPPGHAKLGARHDRIAAEGQAGGRVP